jgi:hypothetical protein
MNKAITFVVFMWRMLILSIALFVICLSAKADIARDGEGKILRSAAVIREFRAMNPCPATGKIQKSCPGYVVDHIMPLCGYGIDKLVNLQYQPIAEAKSKDKLENAQCRAIHEATKQCLGK